MSANVWSEEVERGLKQEILNTVFYLTDTGIKAPLTEDMVFVRDPEEDLREEQIPCVTITPLYNRFDARRYNPNPVIMSRNDEENLLTMQDSAVPFNLFYQIDFWSRYKEDINLMTSTWLRKHFRQFNLKVVDDGGTERSSNAIVNESLRESDFLKNQKRLFHSIISYVIWVELDDEVGYNVHMVAEREILVQNRRKEETPNVCS